LGQLRLFILGLLGRTLDGLALPCRPHPLVGGVDRKVVGTSDCERLIRCRDDLPYRGAFPVRAYEFPNSSANVAFRARERESGVLPTVARVPAAREVAASGQQAAASGADVVEQQHRRSAGHAAAEKAAAEAVAERVEAG
jgi:hypothetical protein